MAILYNRFARAGTALCWLLAGLFMLCAPVRAADVFTVEGIKVDVTAENAMAARDQAFEKAQKEAFAALYARMAVGGGAPANPPETAAISPMIQDYEITEEKLSSVRYIGTYTFRFRARAIQRYFAGNGIQYTDVPDAPPQAAASGIPEETAVQEGAKDENDKSGTPEPVVASSGKTLMILPFYEHQGRSVLWSPYNEWMQAWTRAGKMNGMASVVVPLGDLEDVRAIGDDQALTYRAAALSGMLGRYGAGEAVVAVAEPYGAFANASAAAGSSVSGLRVHLYRTDRASPEYVQQIDVGVMPSFARAAVFDEAVRRVQAELQKNWKENVTARPSASNRIRARMHLANLQEWTQTQKSLARVDGVSEVVLKSLSPREAYIDLVYQGTEDRLRLALQRADMTLDSPEVAVGGWAAAPVYDLRLNRYRENGYSNRF